MFKNPGKFIKAYSKILFWCAIIAAVILLFAALVEGSGALLVAALVTLGSDLLLVYVLYGFGTLIESTQETAQNTAEILKKMDSVSSGSVSIGKSENGSTVRVSSSSSELPPM